MLKKTNKSIWITILVLLLLVLFGLFSCSEENNKEISLEIEKLSTNIRRHYQNKPDFWGLNTQAVLDNKIYPNKMLRNNRLVGLFGAPVSVGRGLNAETIMPGAKSFDIIYKGLNKKQCLAVATSELKQDVWLGVAGISIGNTEKLQRFSWDSSTYSLPIKKAQAKRLCGKNSVVIWHFEQ